jgi:outer membrane protein TolC
MRIARPAERQAKAQFSKGAGLAFTLAGLCCAALFAFGSQPDSFTNACPILNQPLSLADAVNLALHQNPAILRAQKDVEAAQGVVLQTRAIAIPKVRSTASYQAKDPNDVDRIDIPGFPVFGTDQSWAADIRLSQSIYEGGRMASAFRTARLTRDQAWLNYQTAIADAVLQVQIAYADVLLGRQLVEVQEASVELLKRELADTTRRFDAGTVPQFNVLRAEVELANARPKLIKARNDQRIAKDQLSNLLGLNLPKETSEDIPLMLSGNLEAKPFTIELPGALATAFEKRTELGALRKATALRKEDVVAAKAGYKPSVQAFVGYETHSSAFSNDLSLELHGWIGGVALSWNIFDGFLTAGKVKQASALYDRAGIELDDATRQVDLDVRVAWSNLKEAGEVLESQEKVREQAAESLRLANARAEAGSATQLDVLGAQTALTEARTTQIQALHDYSVARSRLERAVGLNIPEQAAAK